MFFVLSKLFGFVSYPINWILFLLGYACWTKKPKRKQKFLLTALLFLFVFTNPFISNRVFRAFEYPEVNMNTLRDTFDIGIVLGGFNDFDIYPTDDRLNFNSAVNRITDAIVLYKRGILKKILISGGSSELLTTKTKNESVETQKFLLQIGVKEADIILETRSRNTYENIKFSKALIDSVFPNAKCMLITSAFHLPRSIKCCDKIGWKVFPFPAHFIAEKLTPAPATYLSPNEDLLPKWRSVTREWLGLIMYKIRGYN